MSTDTVLRQSNSSDISRRGWQIKGSRTQGLAMATLAFFGGFAGVSLFGPLVPKFTELMHLTPLMAGFLAAIPNLSGSLLRIPFGASVDRFGGKRPMMVLLGTTLLGLPGLILMLALFYPNGMTPEMYPLLLLLGAVIGAGIATFSVGTAQVSYWFPQRKQGSALGVFGGLGNTAPGIFAWVLPAVVLALGITNAYLIWLALVAAILVVYARWAVDAPWFQLRAQLGTLPQTEAARSLGQELIPSGGSWKALKESGRDVRTWMLVALYFTSFGGFLALTGWLPSYWHNYYDTPLALGGVLTLTYSLLASLTRVGTGFVTDKLGGETVLIAGLLAMAVGATAIAFSGLFALSLVGMILMGVSMGAQNAAVFKLVPRYISRSVGGASAWIGGLGAFGGFAIPPLMGAIAQAGDHSGYALGFLVFAALGAVNLLITLSLRGAPAPTAPKPVAEVEAQE